MKIKSIGQIVLVLISLLIFACQGNSKKEDTSNELVQEIDTPKIVLNSECDCKNYSIDKKLTLPKAEVLFFLSDSFQSEGFDWDNYRKIASEVNNLRKGYDNEFKKCVERFGEFDIIVAPCTEDEKIKRAFNTALNLVKNNCRASNQELQKYIATKVNGTIVFMFLSVSQNGMVCISGISEIKPDEILSSDCGSASQKIADWESIPEYKIQL